MNTYLNLSGVSNVLGYNYGPDYIVVGFRDGDSYKYTYKSAGEKNVEEMKLLADKGIGLNNFINDNVKKKYEMKME
ncbi:hypothetical protein KKH36_00070 [Patescibacteria group bacterium]|nr:hypothetical protein [Patescibacteria group bacterium]